MNEIRHFRRQAREIWAKQTIGTLTHRTEQLLSVAFIAVFLLMFNGCLTMRSLKSQQGVTPETISTNYDYTKPTDIARNSKPVWILPKTTSGWKKATVDDATGEWRSGQYVAKIVVPGHWATLEEAELLGHPYIVSGQDRPVIPTKTVDQSPRTTGEISTTSVEQKLAKLSTSSSHTSPSAVSLNNQSAVIPTKPTIQGATQTKTPPPPEVAPPLLKIPTVSTPPPPQPSPTPSPSASPSVTPTIPITKPVVPPLVSLPVAKKQPPKYDETTNAVTVSGGEPNTSQTIKTPSGDLVVKYFEKGRVDIIYNGKTETIPSLGAKEKIQIKLD